MPTKPPHQLSPESEMVEEFEDGGLVFSIAQLRDSSIGWELWLTWTVACLLYFGIGHQTGLLVIDDLEQLEIHVSVLILVVGYGVLWLAKPIDRLRDRLGGRFQRRVRLAITMSSVRVNKAPVDLSRHRVRLERSSSGLCTLVVARKGGNSHANSKSWRRLVLKQTEFERIQDGL